MMTPEGCVFEEQMRGLCTKLRTRTFIPHQEQNISELSVAIP
jgi:hypothetical protein